MRSKTGGRLRRPEVQELLDSLHDALVNDVRLEGLDLVLDIRLAVGWVHDPEAPGLPEAPQAKAYRIAFQPYRLVFEGFRGPVPWSLKSHSLDLVEEKDGANLLVTDALEEYVLRARGFFLGAALPEGEGKSVNQEEVMP